MAQEAMENVVYQRSERDTRDSSARQDMRVFNILMAFDGKRTVGTIAREDHYELEDLIGQVQTLLQQGIIEPVFQEGSSGDSAAFFAKMEAYLQQIMGPVSGIIIQESVAEAGHDTSSFPMNKAYELIDQVARSIPDSGEADRFQRAMADALKA